MMTVRYGLFVGGSTLPKEQSGVCSGPLNTPTQTALNMPLPLIIEMSRIVNGEVYEMKAYNIAFSVDAYIGCLLWAGTDDNGEPLDTHYNIYNLSAESRSRIVRDCHYFMLVASTSDIDLSGLEAQAGHDFWLTRNGHGTGFWDGTGNVQGKKMPASFQDCVPSFRKL